MENTSITGRELPKTKLYVDTRTSRSIARAITFLEVLAWIPIVIGGMTTIVSLCLIGSDYSYISLSGALIGLAIIISSIMPFVTIAFLKGLMTITENNEYQKAEFEQKYDVRN